MHCYVVLLNVLCFLVLKAQSLNFILNHFYLLTFFCLLDKKMSVVNPQAGCKVRFTKDVFFIIIIIIFIEKRDGSPLRGTPPPSESKICSCNVYNFFQSDCELSGREQVEKVMHLKRLFF